MMAGDMGEGQVVSLRQKNLTAVRCERLLACQLLRASGAAVIEKSGTV